VELPKAGDIVALIGLDSVDISDTICDPLNPQPLVPEEIEPPTLTMMFSVNDSPFVGKGRQVRHIPQPTRAAVQGLGIERRAEGGGNGEQGCVQGQRPRAAAPGHPDREHAAAKATSCRSASRT
jgi:hypothetical protein